MLRTTALCPGVLKLYAMYKSFKLTVSVNDMGKVLDADFWPEGIMVRRYRTTQSPKWREALTN